MTSLSLQLYKYEISQYRQEALIISLVYFLVVYMDYWNFIEHLRLLGVICWILKNSKYHNDKDEVVPQSLFTTPILQTHILETNKQREVNENCIRHTTRTQTKTVV